MDTFETPDTTTLVVRSGAGHVTITAEDTDRTTVELTPLNAAGEDAVAEARVEQQRRRRAGGPPPHRGGLFRPHPSVGIAITCPTGTTLEVKADSADVRRHRHLRRGEPQHRVRRGGRRARHRLRQAEVRLRHGRRPDASGRRSWSAPVRATSPSTAAARAPRVSVGSGDIRIGELAGEAVTKTGSGDVEVDRLGGTLMTKSGSGNLVVRRATSGSVRANGASGSISIGIEEGTAAWLDVSTLTGRVSQELDQSDAPVRRSAPRRDHRPHGERRPAGAPVMTAVAGARLAPGQARSQRATHQATPYGASA